TGPVPSTWYRAPSRAPSPEPRVLTERITPVCGIAGIVRGEGRPVFEREVRAMCGAMTHRGPDEEGVYLSEGVGLGMRRLSIIDLENGQQPVSNEDGTVWVVFNGEIYNYRE